ncbi:MAG: hypothetical protein GC200_04335 [Tepidisphaera sp.]|nr:hypothetical protein [Tepidisphaera sp.]
MLAPAAPSPACPACRYDLRGQVATWDAAEQCPLSGTCPECGERFEWWFVIREGGRIRGFIEDAYGLRRRITWSVRTTLWALWPWKFWSRVGDAKVKPWGWVWWAAIMVWFVRVINTAGTKALQYVFWRWSSGPTFPRKAALTLVPGLPYLTGLGRGAERIFQERFSDWLEYYTSTGDRAFALEAVAWPLTMLVLAEQPHARQVRLAQIARATVFSLAPLAMRGLVALACNVAYFAYWLVGLLSEVVGASQPHSHDFNWMYQHTFQIMNWLQRGIESVWWLGVVWVPLWWLAAMQRGFKIERAAQVWIVQLILINVILYFLFGPRVDPIRW